MPVRPALIAVAAASAAFYALGRYGHVLPWPEASGPAVQSALAQSDQRPAPAPVAQPPEPGAGQSAPRPAAAPLPQKVDETALRYFASQGDTRRYESELARLRALYPDWRPPTDMTSPTPTGDPELERIWKLVADGKVGEARAAITQRGTADAAWQAPADLLAQLERAEAGQRLINAANARQWEQVIRIGTDTPALLTCANVDALWRVAEAFVQTGVPDRARDAYAYVLTNCTNPAERIGTMQKALATLPDPLLGQLLAQERQSEFSAIRDEIARRRIGKAAEDPALTATPDEIRRLEALANAATTADDAILLGFYALRHKDAAKAATWFQTALSRNGGAKAAEGAVLAFGAQQKYQEAEALGAQWLDAGPANRKAYLDVATALLTQEPAPRLDRAVVERIARTVGVDRYAPGGAGLGWYGYNSGQIAAAETWFETALAWDRGYEPAAYGLALVKQRQRDQAGLRSIIGEWRTRSARIAEVLNPPRGRPVVREPQPLPTASPLVPTQAVPRAEPRLPTPEPAEPTRRALRAEPLPAIAEASPAAASRRPGAARQASGSCRASGSASGAAALQQGWCLLNLKRPAAAAQAFAAAQRSGDAATAADAAAGLAYAKIQQGLTGEAGAAAASAALPPARARELQVLLLSERFYAQYDAKDFNGALITLGERSRLASESTDLMLMRGWSYFNLGRYDDATQVFQALYRANGSSQALSGLTAIRDVTQRNRY